LDTYETDAKNTANRHRPGAPRIPLHELLGIHVVEAAEGRGRLEMVVTARHLRTFGLLHGGVLAALLDAAMGTATATRTPAEHDVVTAQLNVNFIRPAWQGEQLTTTGEVVHAGRRTAVARGEVRTAEGSLVAAASGTFLFTPLADPAHQPPASRVEAPHERD
jgi:uncharacterized protein (TIGR00369 family)